MNSFETLSWARSMATGSPLLVDEPNLSPRCETEAEFDRLVTDYYKFLYEELSRDVTSLNSFKKMPNVNKANLLLYDLRTAVQHSNNDDAVRRADEWRKERFSPQIAADSLASTMRTALDELASSPFTFPEFNPKRHAGATTYPLTQAQFSRRLFRTSDFISPRTTRGERFGWFRSVWRSNDPGAISARVLLTIVFRKSYRSTPLFP